MDPRSVSHERVHPRYKWSGALMSLALLVLTVRLVGCLERDGCCRAVNRRRTAEPMTMVQIVTPEGLPVWTTVDRIPKDRQVGCDVCPEWCGQVDLHLIPMDMLLLEYVHLARRHLDRDATLAEQEEIHRLGCIVARTEPAKRAPFLALLAHPELRVRYTTAYFALWLHMDDEAAIRVLREIEASESEVSYFAWRHLMNHEIGIEILLY